MIGKHKQNDVARPADEINGSYIASHEFNEDRTVAFQTRKKKYKQDSIGWIVWGLVLFFFTMFSAGRITVIGQFFDDAIFNLIFGWFKYPVYLILLLIDICIYSGIRFKFKKRFLGMIITSTLLLSWLITLVLITVISTNATNQYHHLIHSAWSNTILKDTFNVYWDNWKDNSIFSANYGKDTMDFLMSGHGYASTYAGGGIPGALLAGVTSYLSVPGSYILWALLAFLNGMWIFTGDVFFLFKPKAKRKGKALRILSLKTKTDPNAKNKNKPASDRTTTVLVESESKDEMWKSLDVFGSSAQVEEQIAESDLTIKLPSFMAKEKTEQISEGEFINVDEQRNDTLSNHNGSFFKSRRQREEEAAASAAASYVEPVAVEPAADPTLASESDTDFFGNLFDAKDPTITPAPVAPVVEAPIEKTSEMSREQLEAMEYSNKMADKYLEEEPVHETAQPNEYVVPTPTPVAPAPVKEVKKTEVTINKDYQLPPTSLLKEIPKDWEKERKNKENAVLKALAIDEVFNQFNVKAKVVGSKIGPTVTKFEIQPEPGTKVNSFLNLENDFKLALATSNIRLEAPIQGTNFFGIEIANGAAEMVSMREVIESVPKDKDDSKLLFVLGKNVLGDPLTAELNKMPHLLVAGSTGSGKSVMINAMIVSILMRAKPHEVKFLMVDPKKVELSIYTKLPHMLAPVISDMKDAVQALKMVVAEMDRRYELFANEGARNIEGYNKKKSRNVDKLPFIVVIIDELADLMMTADRKGVEEAIMRITQMARAAGIHLVLATQRPSVDVLTGTIKSNVPTRISFAVTTGTDSRTILDSIGAEKLIGRGDMLFMPPGSSELLRAQGAYLSDQEIEDVVDFVMDQQSASYDEVFSDLKKAASGTAGGSSSNDDLYEEVKAYVIEQGKASTSFLQRRFSLGYNRAANLVDALEADGVIGPQNGAKPREVLIKK